MMKRKGWYITGFAIAAFLVLFGAIYAGWIGFHEKEQPKVTVAPKASDEDKPGNDVTLTGFINISNQLQTTAGATYEIAGSAYPLGSKSMIGEKVEVRGTLREMEGRQIVTVGDYKVLE